MKVKILKSAEIPWWYENCLCADFPENEIKPLENIVDLVETGRYDIYVYEEEIGSECQVRGYATIWKRPGLDTFLLDYLGVPSNLRNAGIGAKILRDIRNEVLKKEIESGKYAGDSSHEDFCLIVESETPLSEGDLETNEIRRRRCEFYRRNGYVKMYEMGTCGVRFDAMAFEKIPKNLEKTMKEHKIIYGEERQDVMVPLGKDEKPPLPFWMGK